MDCNGCLQTISASLDGETTGVSDELVERHLAVCATCRRFSAAAARLNRSMRLSAADELPDLTVEILTAIAAEAQTVRPGQRLQRVGLAVVGLLQLLVAVPLLLFGDGMGVPVHVGRELAAFDVALAVGFLVAAYQPARAFGLVPMAGALVTSLLVVAGFDLAAGETVAVGEAAHLVAIAGLALLWQLARPVRRGRTVTT